MSLRLSCFELNFSNAVLQNKPKHLSVVVSFFQFMLLHYKADVNVQDNDGNSPLHVATSHGHEDVRAITFRLASFYFVIRRYSKDIKQCHHKGHKICVAHCRNLTKMQPFVFVTVTQGIRADFVIKWFVALQTFQCAKALIYYDQGVSALNISAANDVGDTSLHFAAKWGFGESQPPLFRAVPSCNAKNLASEIISVLCQILEAGTIYCDSSLGKSEHSRLLQTFVQPLINWWKFGAQLLFQADAYVRHVLEQLLQNVFL